MKRTRRKKRKAESVSRRSIDTIEIETERIFSEFLRKVSAASVRVSSFLKVSRERLGVASCFRSAGTPSTSAGRGPGETPANRTSRFCKDSRERGRTFRVASLVLVGTGQAITKRDTRDAIRGDQIRTSVLKKSADR